MEMQTIPSIAGQTSLLKSLSPQKEKSRNKSNSCTKPNKFHFHLGFPQTLVYRPATTAARKVVSPSTLIGPFQFERALTTRPSTAARAQIQMRLIVAMNVNLTNLDLATRKHGSEADFLIMARVNILCWNGAGSYAWGKIWLLSVGCFLLLL